jgi:hypothetical protein
MYSNIYFVLLITCILVPVVNMQKWTGTFAWNDQCKSSSCCCYAGTLTAVQSGSNLVLSSGARGCATSRFSSTFGYPNGYSFSATGTRGASITYTLSSDSNRLTVTNNQFNYCGGVASRTSSGKNVNPSIILFITIFAIWIFSLN